PPPPVIAPQPEVPAPPPPPPLPPSEAAPELPDISKLSEPKEPAKEEKKADEKPKVKKGSITTAAPYATVEEAVVPPPPGMEPVMPAEPSKPVVLTPPAAEET